MKKPVYLDYAATTPVDPAVAALMSGCLTQEGTFGNPASRSHLYGWQAEAMVEKARGQVAMAVGCDPRELVWTSGATESDNLAIKGIALSDATAGRHLVTSVTEHKAVVDTCHWLARQGFEVTWLRPGQDGLIQPDQLEQALRPDTCLVSLMMVNNETGVIQPIEAFGRLLRDRGIVFHVDAAQAMGKMPFSLEQLPVDLMSFSAHKVYGPKGIGALYVRRAAGFDLVPQMHGGGHERGMRSGTLATHQIAGMGAAFQLAQERQSADLAKVASLRQRFLSAVLAMPGVTLNGHAQSTVPGIVNLSFAGIDSETLMLGMRDLAVSSGSACASAAMEPSYVLQGMGLETARSRSALRFSFGRFTQAEEIDFAVAQLQQTVATLSTKR